MASKGKCNTKRKKIIQFVGACTIFFTYAPVVSPMNMGYMILGSPLALKYTSYSLSGESRIITGVVWYLKRTELSHISENESKRDILKMR